MPKTVAIVGAGPAGCYTAQALVKAVPDVAVTVIDQLATPYGLVRYGVAPDHQGTKAITRQFARLFERQGVHFVGRCVVGRDIALAALRALFDAVVLAPGLAADRAYPAPGAALPGVHGAGAVTRCWNGHPDHAGAAPRLGPSVAILGNGNVALDLARVLAKSEAEFAGSDLDPAHVATATTDIHIIGRAPLEAARFDPSMVKELGGIEGLCLKLAAGDALAPAQTPVTEALAALFARPVAAPRKTLTFHSGWTVARFAGVDRVTALDLCRHGADKTLPCSSVLTAIGFDWDGPFDRDALLADMGADGALGDGLFAAGWFRRGPRGTLPEARTDAQAVAAAVAAWLATRDTARPGHPALLAATSGTTNYDDWRAIDAAEIARAAPGRCRQKLTHPDDIRAVIAARKELV